MIFFIILPLLKESYWKHMEPPDSAAKSLACLRSDETTLQLLQGLQQHSRPACTGRHREALGGKPKRMTPGFHMISYDFI